MNRNSYYNSCQSDEILPDYSTLHVFLPKMRTQESFCFVLVLCVTGIVVASIIITGFNKSINFNSGSHSSQSHTRQRIATRRIKSFTKRPNAFKTLEDEKQRVIRTENILNALGSRNMSELVKPYENTVIIQPLKKLRNDRKAFAVILVTSVAEDIVRRDAIRETWYSWAEEYDCLVYFFIGLTRHDESLEAIATEANLHGDIIVDDFSESYYKLTIKVLRMLKWYISWYKDDPPSYYVKTDHDVFINLPSLMTYLKKIREPNYIGGMRYADSIPHRDPQSKWYVPESVYAEEKFPVYVAGPCYFMNGTLVELLFNASFEVPLIHLEDVYLTGLVASRELSLNVSNVKNLAEDKSVVKIIIRKPRRIKKTLVLHPVDSPDVMRKLFSVLNYGKTYSSMSYSVLLNNSRIVYYFIVLSFLYMIHLQLRCG